ncbi:unnamed protein product [Paramecium sonneborni]|uniref:EGF-like domain-containing protein n=1 Tax=Paramecium sonneborni TaxID=65129 RepID=A0A8S1KF83_9CILI|nr:unnamed protein product [Paramecium sonneborni]
MLLNLAFLFISANSQFFKQLQNKRIQNSNYQMSDHSLNTLYFFTPSQDNSYYMIEFHLEEQDQTFLIFNFDTKSISREDSKIQISSEYDGRLNRRIIIHNENNQESQLQVISNKQTKYEITITPLTKINDNCLNDCNQNGICNNSNCECYEGYLGRDCHLPVFQIKNSAQNVLSINSKIQYYVMDLQGEKQLVSLSFQIEIYAELQISCFDEIKLSYESEELDNLKIVKVYFELNNQTSNKDFLVFVVEKLIGYDQHLRTLSINQQHKEEHSDTNNDDDKKNNNNNANIEKDNDDNDDDNSITIKISIGVGVGVGGGLCLCLVIVLICVKIKFNVNN